MNRDERNDMGYIDREREAKLLRKKKRKKARIIKRVIIGVEVFVSVILLLLIILLKMPNAKSTLINAPFGKFFLKFLISEESVNNVIDTTFNDDDVKQNEELNTDVMDEYINLLLFGVDSRDDALDSITHSDSMILISINKTTSEVKMVSLYRDTFLRIMYNDGSSTYRKLNYSYFVGGPVCTINTINMNYDLNITDYATVNFAGLADIIDALGGVDVLLTQSEMYYTNIYLEETMKVTGRTTNYLTTYSTNGEKIHLDGLQAVAYCRIRYTKYYGEDGTEANNDMGRTCRQRNVISKLIAKAKTAGTDALLEIANAMFESQSETKTFITSLTYDEIIDLIPILIKCSFYNDAEKSGFPYEYGFDTINYESMVTAEDLVTNVKALHEYLYGETDYEPTSTVKRISEILDLIAGEETD